MFALAAGVVGRSHTRPLGGRLCLEDVSLEKIVSGLVLTLKIT